MTAALWVVGTVVMFGLALFAVEADWPALGFVVCIGAIAALVCLCMGWGY